MDPMRFSPASTLNGIIDSLMTATEPVDRAKAENIRWESRIAAVRIAHYEGEIGSPDPEDFAAGHGDYVANHINLRRGTGEPACFAAANAPALVPTLAPTERLVRVEDMTGWAERIFGRDDPADLKDPERLKAAFESGSAQFTAFLKSWNEAADLRPMFAAVVGDLDDLQPDWRASWWTALPELLGLGHLGATKSHPRALALMEYPASRVLDEAGTVDPAHRFAAPTVIDHHLNAYFCPSPEPVKGAAISYGRAVNLNARGTLVCEMIHRHISYQPGDVKAIVVLTETRPWATVPDMRAAHLTALRSQPGWAGFGVDATGS